MLPELPPDSPGVGMPMERELELSVGSGVAWPPAAPPLELEPPPELEFEPSEPSGPPCEPERDPLSPPPPLSEPAGELLPPPAEAPPPLLPPPLEPPLGIEEPLLPLEPPLGIELDDPPLWPPPLEGIELEDPPPDEPEDPPEEPEEPPDDEGMEGAGMLGEGIVGIIKGLMQPVSRTEIAAAAVQRTAFGRHRLTVVSADAFIVCAPELTSEGTLDFLRSSA